MGMQFPFTQQAPLAHKHVSDSHLGASIQKPVQAACVVIEQPLLVQQAF